MPAPQGRNAQTPSPAGTPVDGQAPSMSLPPTPQSGLPPDHAEQSSDQAPNGSSKSPSSAASSPSDSKIGESDISIGANGDFSIGRLHDVCARPIWGQTDRVV